MILFWLIAALFVAIALAFVLPPLLQRESADSGSDELETNVAVYRDQLSELDADLQNGIISAEQYQQDREEIERRMLSDVSPTPEKVKETSKKSAAGRGPVYAIALGIPIIAVGFYYQVGTPNAIVGRRMAVAPSSTSRVRPAQNPAGADGANDQGAYGSKRCRPRTAFGTKSRRCERLENARSVLLQHGKVFRSL